MCWPTCCSWGWRCPLSILAAAAAYQFTRRADLSLVLFAAFAALSLTVWADELAALLAEPLRVGAVGRFLQFPYLSVRSLDAAHLAGGPGGDLDGVVSLHPAVREGAARLPGPERPAGLPAR